MEARFKFIVVGAGMMGSAAAKYLAQQSDGVALIGPLEPDDASRHRGVFASHYDEARIARTIDTDPIWAQLAHRSIGRYADIASNSGIDFYGGVGCLMVGPQRGGQSSYIGDICAAAERSGVLPSVIGDDELVRQFPYFSFPSASEGVHEVKDAGYINPRRLVQAQTVLAERAGASRIAETVVSISEGDGYVRVQTAEGHAWEAEKVIVATGGFSIADKLLPEPLALSVYARTVAFFEIVEEDLAAYQGMPSLIHDPAEASDHIYLLPPVRYPDGKVYLKIGGDPDDLSLHDVEALSDWFRGGGRESTRRHLKRIIETLVPWLADVVPTMGACVTTFTPSGYPAIGHSTDRIAVLTGGCGAAAKSSDEFGRLGAELLLTGDIQDRTYAGCFQPQFR